MKGVHVNVGGEGSSDEAGGRREANDVEVEICSSSTSLFSSRVKRAVVSFDSLRLGEDISIR